MDQLRHKTPVFEAPTDLTPKKCGPLERTVFVHKFKTAHIDF